MLITTVRRKENLISDYCGQGLVGWSLMSKILSQTLIKDKQLITKNDHFVIFMNDNKLFS